MDPIHIFSDVVCPWCFVGKARLDTALAELGLKDQVEIVWHPYELNPNAAVEGRDRREYLLERFGDPKRLEQADARLNQMAADSGIKDFDIAAAQRIPNTFQAHRLIALAQKIGKAHEASELLFRSNFIEGGFIGDDSLLADIGAKVGLDRAAVLGHLASREGMDELRAEEQEGLRLGIRGVPFYVIQGLAFSGAQPVDTFKSALLGTLQPARKGED